MKKNTGPVRFKLESVIHSVDSFPPEDGKTIEIEAPSEIRLLCMGGFPADRNARLLLLLQPGPKTAYTVGNACFPSIYVLEGDTFKTMAAKPRTMSLAEVRGLVTPPGK